jgi:hypothetical protein
LYFFFLFIYYKMVRENNGPSVSNNEAPSFSSIHAPSGSIGPNTGGPNMGRQNGPVGPTMDGSPMHGPTGPTTEEPFGNMTINTDLVLKAVFWGAIFYLLCLPQVHKMTAKVVGNKVDGSLVHAVIYAVLYFVLSQFI